MTAAQTHTDRELLTWIWDRLRNEYGEHPGTAYMQRLAAIAKAQPENARTDVYTNGIYTPQSIASWAKILHENAVKAGWWDGFPDKKARNVGELLALAHSEISEALEEYRKGRFDEIYYVDGKPEGGAIEVADAIIRLLEMAEARGWDIEYAMVIKHSYNLTRPHRHGGKLA